MTSGAEVLELLRRQQAMYREMTGLVAGQREPFASLDVDAILGLIERKRTILAEVDRLEAELAPVKADWSAIRSSLSTDEARAIEATLEETQQVLRELMRLEDEGRALMERRHEAASQDLKSLMLKNRARRAYGA